jgi:hypothetical protein
VVALERVVRDVVKVALVPFHVLRDVKELYVQECVVMSLIKHWVPA